MKKYIALLVIASLLLIGCAQKETTPTPTPVAPVTTTPDNTVEQVVEEVPNVPTSAEMVIKDKAFQPDSVTIKAGGSVTVMIEDDAAHIVTVKGTDTRSPRMLKGDKYDIVFDKAGTYELYDTVYKKTATVVVE